MIGGVFIKSAKGTLTLNIQITVWPLTLIITVWCSTIMSWIYKKYNMEKNCSRNYKASVNLVLQWRSIISLSFLVIFLSPPFFIIILVMWSFTPSHYRHDQLPIRVIWCINYPVPNHFISTLCLDHRDNLQFVLHSLHVQAQELDDTIGQK